jgi:predicted O-methyltransferase YrrM
MYAERRIEPEILDFLPAEDPRAIAARRDLRVLNAVMLQNRIMARLLRWCCREKKPRRIIELGGGDGSFIVSLAKRLGRHWPGVKVISVDRQGMVTEQTRESVVCQGWQLESVKVDVFEFLADLSTASADVVIANLFLHHLSADELHFLFAAVERRAKGFAACEPRRAPAALLSSRFVWALGCNAVTRHDAITSVRAGFRDYEISPFFAAGKHWQLLERPAFPFTHCFAARRNGSDADHP